MVNAGWWVKKVITLAALPVGASSTEWCEMSGKAAMRALVIEVFPVPANPFSRKSFSVASGSNRYELKSCKAVCCEGVGVCENACKSA